MSRLFSPEQPADEASNFSGATTVYKCALDVADVQTVKLQRGAEILHANVQHGAICIWYRCNRDAPIDDKRTIAICGTGHNAPDSWRYIGTVMMHGGSLVFHVFEARP